MNFFRLLVCSVSFSIVAAAFKAWFCYADFSECNAATDISIYEALPPILFVFGLFVLAGLGIAFLIEQIAHLTTNASSPYRLLTRLMSGGIIGYSAHALFANFFLGRPVLTSLNFPIENLPFAFAGIVCAFVSHFFTVSSARPLSGSKAPNS